MTDAVFTRSELTKQKKDRLVAILRSLRLAVYGNKDVLIDRILDYQNFMNKSISDLAKQLSVIQQADANFHAAEINLHSSELSQGQSVHMSQPMELTQGLSNQQPIRSESCVPNSTRYKKLQNPPQYNAWLNNENKGASQPTAPKVQSVHKESLSEAKVYNDEWLLPKASNQAGGRETKERSYNSWLLFPSVAATQSSVPDHEATVNANQEKPSCRSSQICVPKHISEQCIMVGDQKTTLPDCGVMTHSLSINSACSDNFTSRKQEIDYLVSQSIDACRTSAVEPAVFNGDFLVYSRWSKCFLNYISRKRNITAIDKMFYLEKYTKGEARELIESYLPLSSDRAFKDAWADLQNTYGNDFLIAQSYKGKLSSWPKIPAQDGVGLRKFANFLKQCRTAMSEIPHLSVLDDCDRNQEMIKVLPNHVRDRWNYAVTEYQVKNNYSFPPFSVFVDFMTFEAQAASNPVTSHGAQQPIRNAVVKERMSDDAQKHKLSNNNKPTVILHKTDTQVKRTCPHCNSSDHVYLAHCPKFKDEPTEQRRKLVRDLKACYRCLSVDHFIAKCKRDWQCSKCHEATHNTLLHLVHTTNEQSSKGLSQTLDTVCTATQNSSVDNIFSQTVPVWVSVGDNSSREILTYALLDSQSNRTFITHEIADNLDAIKMPAKLDISTMTTCNKEVACHSVANLRVRGYNCLQYVDLPRTFTRNSVPCCKSDIATQDNVCDIAHLRSISSYIAPRLSCDVGLLIGRDCVDALTIEEITKPPKGHAQGIKTILGWSVMGPKYPVDQGKVSSDKIGVSHVSLCTLKESTLAPQSAICFTAQIKDITPQELMHQIDGCEFESSQTDSTVSQDDLKFIDILDKQTSQNQNGYYVMPLPFRENGSQLSCNREPVLKRFYGLLAQFKRRDAEFKTKYTDFMNGIISRGEAELVSGDNLKSGEGWYLPHHGVFHKKTGKIRVVFDCSAEYRGHSLNEMLYQGPDLNNSLLGVLLRFREKPVAVSCDIEKMYHRFRVAEEHRDYMRFFWNDQTYRMCVHIFGARSSPNCAKYALNRLAEEHGSDYPQAKEFIQNNFYVDDGLTSVNTCAEAVKLLRETKSVCSQGNLRVHKILSNKEQVLHAFPAEDTHVQLDNTMKVQLVNSAERALGMLWSLNSDSFQYQYEPNSKQYTRRSILANVASIYDPMGLLSPLILSGRLMLQETCRLALNWDDVLDDQLAAKWKIWAVAMSKISTLNIPRCIQPEGFAPTRHEIHTFADASEHGYGACTYVRLFDVNDEIHCTLMLGKSKVAPLKKVTIPRLELQAALLAAKQSRSLCQEMHWQCDSYLWSDSQVVLGYINNDAKRFHTYVANRITQIQNISTKDQWHYVRTDRNPGDLASRGVSTVHDLKSSMWFTGPDFLWRADPIVSAASNYLVDPNDTELRKTSTVVHASDVKEYSGLDAVCLEIVNRSSSWYKTKASIAMIRNIVSNKTFKGSANLSVESLKLSESYILATIQNQSFSKEMKQLKAKQLIDKSSSLWSLDCYIDSDGVMRVGGRMKFSTLLECEKHPIILPKKSNLTLQIIQYYHDKVAHQGRTSTMAAVRSAGFWVVGLSTTASSIIHNCTTCRRLRRPMETQKMADLPADRVEVAAPFTHSGCDVFGPFQVRDGRKHCKRYGLLFTCLASRAVHIEVLEDLSTDCFIQSLRCFTALRGNLSTLRCDNGTNFVGAHNELTKQFQNMMLDNGTVAEYLRKNQCKFIFNVPHASHMGGSWERLIRSIRSVFAGLIPQTHSLNTMNLRTLMYECMAIINSRPLTTISPDCMPLSPNDLLNMKTSIVLPMPGKFEDHDLYAKKRWRMIQLLVNNFWTRWKHEYVQGLQSRQKWLSAKRNLAVGDVVIIHEECSRLGWKLGRVVEAKRSEDGLVRSVNVESVDTLTGRKSLLKRPVGKLVCLIEST